MNRRIYKSIFCIIGCLLLIAPPVLTTAQELPVLPSGRVPGADALNFLPTVPISNPAYEAKETGINIFGYKIPISWDGLAISIAKIFIQRMTASTVTWINNGFEGNPPYATNPKQYFADIADGVAGQFIAGSDLNFLCSPFQTQVRLALRQQYLEPLPFECTLTDVVANIDNFYNDFDEGGWDAWFSMTQNKSNNPYGAYLNTQLELKARIANAVGLQREQLNWDRGFISWSDCAAKNPPEWLKSGDPGYDPSYGAEFMPNPNYVAGKPEGACIKRGPTKTPGLVIESQLENVLGSGLRQLELADEFDELTSAVMGQLLQKTIFGAKGLFDKDPSTSRDLNNNARSNTNPTPPSQQSSGIDIDGDNINDIIATGDGEYQCLYGGEYPSCTGSRETSGAPIEQPEQQ